MACGTVPFGAGTCELGACVVRCAEGRASCDQNLGNGCEVNLDTDPANCGACGRACGTGEVCAQGSCQSACPAGLTACGGSCVDLDSDPAHCGGCFAACESSSADSFLCAAGACVVARCPGGAVDADGLGLNGCEQGAPEGAVLIVDALTGSAEGDGTDLAPYADIQAALAAAQPGDRIVVMPGTYTAPIIAPVEDVILEGADRDRVVITVPGGLAGVTVRADHVTVRSLTLRGGKFGVHFQGTVASPITGGGAQDLRIEDLSEVAGPSSGAAGIVLDHTHGVVLSANTVHRVAADDGVSATCSGCEGSAGGIARGILVRASDGFTLSGNQISEVMGGPGGAASPSSTGGPGGAAVGVDISGATGNVYNNVIDLVAGGPGGPSSDGTGGAGGLGAGIRLAATSGLELRANRVGEVTGGLGGFGANFGATGADQQGFGLYLEPDALANTVRATNTVGGDPLVYVYGGSGEVIEGLVLTAAANPTNLGKLVVLASEGVTVRDNVLASFRAASGCSGGQSAACAGDPAAGIRLEGCSGCIVEGNSVELIRGGTGGSSGILGTAGAGGDAAGIWVRSAPGAVVRSNSVASISAGAPGEVGLSADPGSPGKAAGFRVEDSDSLVLSHGQVWDLEALASGDPEPAASCVLLDASGGLDVSHLTCIGANGLGGSSAGLTVRAGTSSPVRLVASIVTGTSAACAWADPAVSGAILSAEFSVLHDCGAATVFGGAVGPGVEGDAPRFVNAAGGDLHLRTDSPGVDAAGPGASYCGEPAPNGCAANAGAFGNTPGAVSVPGAPHCACD